MKHLSWFSIRESCQLDLFFNDSIDLFKKSTDSFPRFPSARHIHGLEGIYIYEGLSWPMIDPSSSLSSHYYMWGRTPIHIFPFDRILNGINNLHPNPKHGPSLLCKITVSIIFFIEGMRGCGVKYSPMAFTNSTV